jgi:hypothetical protein
MPKFSNGKITTNVIFYNRGIPNDAKNFGTLTTVNYEVLKALSIYNRNMNVGNRRRRSMISLYNN